MTSRSAVEASATSPTPAKVGRLRLVACVGARWPKPTATLGAKLLRPEKLLDKLADTRSWPCWLGYSSPINLLTEHQPADAAALEELLETWLEHAATFLEARLQAPERCRLINLSHLDGPGLSRLLEEVSDDTQDSEAEGEPANADAVEPSEPSEPEELPLLLQLYLQRRPDVLNRYADLEGQAELLGRKPEFTLPLSRPDADSWAALLLNSWETQVQLATSQEQITELEAQLSEATTETDQLRQAATSSEELEQAQQHLQEAREEAELTLLQLHQVQEELEYQFLEHRKASQLLDERQQQLTSLEAEMSYYFLLSQADPCLEQERIPQLKALMRATLIAR
jgi:DNA repair exonuclease SbcCD ATPase subunit